MRRQIDFSRLSESLSRPGMDPRSWVCMARIDDDPDSMVWDTDLGWLVDVTIVGGPMDAEGPIQCRTTTNFQDSDSGEYRPPRPGLVAVLIPNGDPNDDAIIIGQLHDVDDLKAPTTINGDTITEDFALITHITVAPEHDLDQQWQNIRITADEMILGTATADQPFVRGDDYADSLNDFLDALSSVIAALAVAPVVGAAVALDPTSLANFQIALNTFKAARNTYNSQRIKGD